LRYRFAASSGIKHGSKAIRWTADARYLFLLSIPHNARRRRSSSLRKLTAFVGAKGGLL
jgi:hypothetical protein